MLYFNSMSIGVEGACFDVQNPSDSSDEPLYVNIAITTTTGVKKGFDFSFNALKYSHK